MWTSRVRTPVPQCSTRWHPVGHQLRQRHVEDPLHLAGVGPQLRRPGQHPDEGRHQEPAGDRGDGVELGHDLDGRTGQADLLLRLPQGGVAQGRVDLRDGPCRRGRRRRPGATASCRAARVSTTRVSPAGLEQRDEDGRRLHVRDMAGGAGGGHWKGRCIGGAPRPAEAGAAVGAASAGPGRAAAQAGWSEAAGSRWAPPRRPLTGTPAIRPPRAAPVSSSEQLLQARPSSNWP